MWLGLTKNEKHPHPPHQRYRPTALVGKESRVVSGRVLHEAINRPITSEEFAVVESVARAAGLRRFNHDWPAH